MKYKAIGSFLKKNHAGIILYLTQHENFIQYDQKYKDPMYAFAAEKPSTGKIIHLQQVSKKGNKWQI